VRRAAAAEFGGDAGREQPRLLEGGCRRRTGRRQFRGIPAGNRSLRFYWLILENGELDICYRRPGFEEDLVVKADLGSFTRAWLGYVDYRKEMRAGRIAIDGLAKLAQSFWHWMGVVDRLKGVWRMYPETPTIDAA
jgi:hypothetical protein